MIEPVISHTLRERGSIVNKLMTAIALFIGLGASVVPQPAAASSGEKVVLLHGIAQSESSMRNMEAALKKEGYATLAITYPSTNHDLEGIAKVLRDEKLSEDFWNQSTKVHFVTHSMGGLVVRKYLEQYKDIIPQEKLGRVVMIAPPNRGSDVADFIHNLRLYKWYYGPAGQELTTSVQAKNTEPPYYDLGIIAGTKEWPYIVSVFVISGKSDGRVSVEKTKLKGMTDHITVPATHSFIHDKPIVHNQVLCFLQTGHFKTAKESAASQF